MRRKWRKQLKSKEQVDVGAFILFTLFFNLSLNHVNYYKSSDIMYKQVRTVQLFVTQMSQRDYYQWLLEIHFYAQIHDEFK